MVSKILSGLPSPALCSSYLQLSCILVRHWPCSSNTPWTASALDPALGPFASSSAWNTLSPYSYGAHRPISCMALPEVSALSRPIIMLVEKLEKGLLLDQNINIFQKFSTMLSIPTMRVNAIPKLVQSTSFSSWITPYNRPAAYHCIPSCLTLYLLLCSTYCHLLGYLAICLSTLSSLLLEWKKPRTFLCSMCRPALTKGTMT